MEHAAETLNVKPEQLDAWEKGAAHPTFRQAQDFARRFNVPFGFLFLSEPPVETLPLPDLRTMGDQPARNPSVDLLDVINDVIIKQIWYREYQQANRAESVSFIGRYSLRDDVEVIARGIRETIGIDAAFQRQVGSPEGFLRLLSQKVEASGVLVMRSGIVENNTHRTLDVKEFRGLAISDPLAPIIFVNSRDATSAQVFTLAHELTHL